MKRIQLFAALMVAGFFLAVNHAQGQYSQQLMSFSVVGDYETATATIDAHKTTNVTSVIKTIEIGSANVIKAISLDLLGTNTTTWTGGQLIRKVNLTTGAEGIFLRKGNNETNVSAFFAGSFTNNFSELVTSNIQAVATKISYMTNGVIITNSISTTNALYAVALKTTNLTFNLFGFGTAVGLPVKYTYLGTPYSNTVSTLNFTGAGSIELNVTTNFFDLGTNDFTTNFVAGPASGTLITSPGAFTIVGVSP